MTAVHTAQNTCPQLSALIQTMPAGYPPKYLVAAVLASMVIHAFLAYLLCAMVVDRTAVVGPAAPSIGSPLIVSLESLPMPATDSHDGPDSEVAPVVPHAEPAAQHSQSHPERSRSIERKSESESVMISKDQGEAAPEAPAGKPPATGTIPAIEMDSASSMAREVVRIPGFEVEIDLTSKDRGNLGPEAPAGKFLATSSAPSILNSANSIAQEVGRESMTEFELQDLRFKSRALYLKNHLGITKEPCPDCRTAYAGLGLLAIPFLIKGTITDSGCTWDRLEVRERQIDLGRQKDQERLEFMSNLINDLVFDPP